MGLTPVARPQRTPRSDLVPIVSRISRDSTGTVEVYTAKSIRLMDKSCITHYKEYTIIPIV